MRDVPAERLLVVAVAAVLFRGERILAMRRSAWRDAGAGLWETPSGRVRANEDPLAAVRREISEECALNVELEERPVTVYATFRGASPMVVIVYRGRVQSGEVVASDEHDAFDWLTLSEFDERTTLSKLAAAARLAGELPW